MPTPCDIVLTGGRVIDPESGLDEVCAVGIRDGRIVHIGEDDVSAARVLDIAGLVVAPGFIDMHSHAQTIAGHRLQALDGVTTSLELEGGALPVADHYAWAESQGRPLNFGYSAGWAYARMHVLDGAPTIRPQDDADFRVPMRLFERFQDGPRWQEAVHGGELERIGDLVDQQLAAGAIGVGVLAGYVPRVGAAELSRLAALAAEKNHPLFVHSRSMSQRPPVTALDAVEELIELAETHAAPVHLCHMNSTSGHLAAEVAAALLAARERGVRVTTEAYPYAAGSTVIGAPFIAPEALAENGLAPSSVVYLATGERVADAARLNELRDTDPGGLCILESFDLTDPHDETLLLDTQTLPGAAIASDAMPLTYVGEEAGRRDAERAAVGDVWPLPDGLFAHPRSAGCFATALSWLVRQKGVLTLADAIRRATLTPARILQNAAPAMAAKGRIKIGADADITVFDPDTVGSLADYRSIRPATGFQYVFVAGTPVVYDGEIDPGALPGRAVRGSG